MAKAVDPGNPTIVRAYQLAAGTPARLDDLFAPCLVVLAGAILGQNEQAAAAAAAAGAVVTAVVGPLEQLVGVWAAAPAPATVMVVSR